jgi:hypothetical protein
MSQQSKTLNLKKIIVLQIQEVIKFLPVFVYIVSFLLFMIFFVFFPVGN